MSRLLDLSSYVTTNSSAARPISSIFTRNNISTSIYLTASGAITLELLKNDSVSRERLSIAYDLSDLMLQAFRDKAQSCPPPDLVGVLIHRQAMLYLSWERASKVSHGTSQMSHVDLLASNFHPTSRLNVRYLVSVPPSASGRSDAKLPHETRQRHPSPSPQPSSISGHSFSRMLSLFFAYYYCLSDLMIA